MNILLIGGSGGIGKELIPLLWGGNYTVDYPSSTELNLKDEKSIENYLKDKEYNVVIHSAVRNFDSPLHKTDPSQADDQLDTNALGLINLLKFVIPMMRKKMLGRIIYLSSILSKQPIRGTGIYSACKAFNETLIRVAALENAKYGITCNSIRLGYMEVGLISKVPESVLEDVKNTIPLGRFGTVKEIYNAIHFLIETEYVTGVALDVNGGL